MRASLLSTICLGLVLSAASARADIVVSFDTGGVGEQTVANDKVTLHGVSGGSVTFSGAPYQTITRTINYLDWFVSPTRPGGSTVGGLNFDRTMTMTVGTQTLEQGGALSVLKKFGLTGDTLSLYEGDELSFDFGSYKILVAAVDFQQSRNVSRNYTGLPIEARFQFVPVPEPSTMVAGAGALGLLLAGFGAQSKKRVLKIGK